VEEHDGSIAQAPPEMLGDPLDFGDSTALTHHFDFSGGIECIVR